MRHLAAAAIGALASFPTTVTTVSVGISAIPSPQLTIACVHETAATHQYPQASHAGGVWHPVPSASLAHNSHPRVNIAAVRMMSAQGTADHLVDPASDGGIDLDNFRRWRDMRLPDLQGPTSDDPPRPGLSRGCAVGGPGLRPSLDNSRGKTRRRQRGLRWLDGAESPAPHGGGSGGGTRGASLRALAFPTLTLVAAWFGLASPQLCAPLGSVAVLQCGLVALMLSMGLTLTPLEMRRALTAPRAVALNAALCFGAMPLVALGLSRLLRLDGASASGLVLLGSVSGGQASNLCALLAGGDLALSVVLTVSTTLLGALATPALVAGLLGATVAVDALGVLRSICALVFAPLAAGVLAGSAAPAAVAAIQPHLPRLGIAALLVLVTGGSANAATLLVDAAGAWRSHRRHSPAALRWRGRVRRRAGVWLQRATAAHAQHRGGHQIARARLCPREEGFADAAVTAVPAASMVWLAAIGAAAATRGASSHRPRRLLHDLVEVGRACGPACRGGSGQRSPMVWCVSCVRPAERSKV